MGGERGFSNTDIPAKLIDRYASKYELNLLMTVIKPYVEATSEKDKRVILHRCSASMKHRGRNN